MKFKQYQSGGAIYTPFISSRGVSQAVDTTSASERSASKTDKAADAIQKEIIDILKEHGLQNDVNKFLESANNFLTRSQNLSTMTLFGGEDDNYTMSHLIGVLQLANGVKRNKGQYDLATANLKEQRAGNEAAIASNGFLYVIDEDYNMSTISPEEFYQNKDRYQVLTNSQVLGLRENDPNLAYNTTILDDVSGAIGMKVITDQLTDIITKFGHLSRSEYINKTGDNISQKTWDGMQILINNGPDGYYKATTKSEKENLNSAVMYLWNAIGANGQKKLAATAAISGLNPHKNKYDIIMQALDLHTDYEQSIDFDSSASNYDPDGDKKRNNSNSSEVTDTLAEKYTSGSGAPPPRYEILMTSKSGVPMYAFTQDLGPVLNSDGKSAKGNANLEDVLTNGYGLTTVDKRSITFGDQLIEWSDANKIVYDASTNLKRVYLPATKVNGRITPDFEMYNKISELNESVKDQGLSDDQIAKLVESAYSNLTYNRNTGLIEAKNTQLFFTFGAIASTDTYGRDIKNSNWRIEQSDEVDRSWQNTYNRLIGYSTNSSTPKGTETGNRETGNGFMPWNWGYKFYKGNIFIPVVEPMLASTIYNDQYWPKEDYRYMTQKAEANARQQIRESASNIKTGF